MACNVIMEELEKSLRINNLLDYYVELLTNHQKEILILYYQMDLSLSEISEQLKISRNGVYDALKKGTELLEKYEEKLHLLEKAKQLEIKFNEIKQNCNEKELDLINKIESMVK